MPLDGFAVARRVDEPMDGGDRAEPLGITVVIGLGGCGVAEGGDELLGGSQGLRQPHLELFDRPSRRFGVGQVNRRCHGHSSVV